MSDIQQSSDFCAAYGCPLFGTVGNDGRWYCFCHVNKPSALNDPITRMLREDLAHVVDSTLDIRRNFSSFIDNPAAYRAIQKRLIDAGRKDLLLGDPDCSPHRPGKPIVKMWLQRLERELIDQTGKLGEQQRIPLTVPTAAVVGPTHAMEHYTEHQQ